MLAFLVASVFQPDPVWDLHTDDTRVTVTAKASGEWVEIKDRLGNPWGTRSALSMIDKVWVNAQEAKPQWVRTEAKEESNRLVVTYRNAQPALEFRSIWRARPGRGPVEHWVEIVNHTSERVAVPEQESLGFNIEASNGTEAWYIRRGASNALTQGGTFHEPVKVGQKLNLVSDHHNPSSPVPWVCLQSCDRGLYVGWEFSGLGHVTVDTSERSSRVSAGLLPDFKTDILANESLTIPTAFVGCYRGDLDEGSFSLHRFVLEKLRAKPPKTFADPTTILGIYLDAGGDKAKEADLVRCAQFGKDLGLDVFFPDAMWFPACGDWRWDPDRFPNGVEPIYKAAWAGHMKFGLWCAWNNGGISEAPGALSVRGPQGHPDWFGEDLPADWQPGPFYGAQADMGSPEAKAWAIKKTQQMVGDFKLDMLKTDVHPMIQQCNRTDHRHSYGSDVSYWSCLGVYEVWDKLRQAFPNIVLENCSGASHIKDFGVVQRCAYTATTDTLSNLPDRAGVYDSTYVLPPSALLTYTYERGYGVPGDDPGSFLARSGMMTSWNLAPTNSKGWTDEEKESTRWCLRTYKTWLRPILADCKVHHVMPRPDGKHWDGMFYWSEKLGRGTFFVFRPDSDSVHETVKLAGLESSKEYRVWCEDGSVMPGLMSGSSLMSQGLRLRLPAKYTSDLVHVQEASRPAPNGFGAPRRIEKAEATTASDYLSPSVTFKWSKSQGARSYRVTVSQHPDFSSPVLEQVVYMPRLETKKLPENTKLYWRVDALNWGGSSSTEIKAFQSLSPKPWPGVFVSDMTWKRAVNGVPEGLHRDENYAGNPLSLGGKKYPKGVWTHSFENGQPADLVLDIEGKGYGVFASDVGVDDASGGGSVQFEVLVDGRVVAETPIMKPGQVQKLKVDVTGAKELTLRVLNGGDGYTSDHSTWGMARLIKVGALDPFAGQ